MTRKTAALGLCLLVTIFARIPGHAQSPGQPIFEPGFEGEIWKTQPPHPMGFRVQAPCLTEAEWALIDSGNAGLIPNHCSEEEMFNRPEELYLPVGVAVYEPTGLPADPTERRIFISDTYNDRIAVFVNGANGRWVPLSQAVCVNPAQIPCTVFRHAVSGEVPPYGAEARLADWRYKPGGSANLDHPQHITVDAGGNLWVADLWHARIAIFSPRGMEIGEIPLGNPVTFPYAVALNEGAIWGRPGSRAAVIAIDDPSQATHLIIFDTLGTELDRHVSQYGTEEGRFALGTDVAYHRQILPASDPRGYIDRLIIADADNFRFQVFQTDRNGQITRAPEYVFGDTPLLDKDGNEIIESVVHWPYSVFVDARGRVIAADSGGNRLVAYQMHFTGTDAMSAEYLFQLTSDGGLDGTPRGIGEDADGRLYIVDTGNNQAEVFEIPELAVVQVEVIPVTSRVGPNPIVLVDFTVLIPPTKTSVGNVTPRCELASGGTSIQKLSGPVAIDGTPDLSAGGDYPMEPVDLNRYVYRYECTFEVVATGPFTVNLWAKAGPVAAPTKAAEGTVIDCGTTCEDVAPTISATAGPAEPDGGPHNQDRLDPGVLGYYQGALIALTADDTVSGTGIRRIYFKWVGPRYGDGQEYPCDIAQSDPDVQCVSYATAAATRTVIVSDYQTAIREIEYWTEDFSGNFSAHGSLVVAVDVVAPQLSAATTYNSPPPSSGWWNGDVAWRLVFNDDLSANADVVVTMPPPPSPDIIVPGRTPGEPLLIIKREGRALVGTVRLADLAHNSADYDVGATTNIDRGKPTTTGVAGGVTLIPHPPTPQIVQIPLNATSTDLTLGAQDPRLADGTPGSGVPTSEVAAAPSAGIWLTRDGGPATRYAPPQPFGLNEHNIVFWSTDIAINAEVSKTGRFYVNAPPRGVADGTLVPIVTDDNTPIDINVVVNDRDDNDDATDPLSVVPGSLSAVSGGGTVSLNPDGTVRYTPPANVASPTTVTFTYRVRDSHLAQDPGNTTVTVAVLPANDGPAAVTDTANTNVNVAVTIHVVNNDTDPDTPNAALTISGVTNGTNGSAAIGLDLRSVVYTPNAGFIGQDSFTYTVSDGLLTATGTVNVTVSTGTCVLIRPGLTDAQVAALHFYQFGVAEGRAGDLSRTDTYEMSIGRTTSDPWRTAQFAWTNGQAEPFSLVYNGTSVVFKLGAGSRMKTLTWTGGSHDHDACDDRDHDDDGDDDEDDRNRFDLNALLIRARGENGYGTMSLSDLVLDGTPLNQNFSAPAGANNAQTLALIGLEEPTFTLTGSARITWTGTWSGSPSRSNKVAFQIMGGHIHDIAGCGGVNAAPAAVDDTSSGGEDQSQTINVLGNDSDPDEDSMEVSSVTDPPHGTAVINTNGTIKYTPDANFHGIDTFTYTVTDSDKTDTGTVTVTVTALNDKPIAQNKSATTPKNTPVTINLLAGASDADGDALTVTAVSNPPKGSVALSGGIATYTPDRNFRGTDSFSYTVSDGHGGSVTKTVTVTVGEVDDHDNDHDGHHDGDRCDHDRNRNGHRDGDSCQHDRKNHDGGRRGHRDGDDCAEDRDHRRRG